MLSSFLSFGKNEGNSFKISMNFIGYFVHEVIFGANIFYLGFCFCSSNFSYCGGVDSCAFWELHYFPLLVSVHLKHLVVFMKTLSVCIGFLLAWCNR